MFHRVLFSGRFCTVCILSLCLTSSTVLNDDKTEFIVFKSKHNVNTFAEQNVQVGGTKVGISSKIKNLWVTFDQTLSMQAHVNTIAFII